MRLSVLFNGIREFWDRNIGSRLSFRSWRKRFYRQWGEQRRKKCLDTFNERHLLILPSDLKMAIGSRGDEAMIMAVAAAHEGWTIGVLAETDEAARLIEAHGWQSIKVKTGRYPLDVLMQAARNIRPERALVLGADVMDGYYSPKVSMIQLAMTDLLRSAGIRTSLTSFSLNPNVERNVAEAFRHLPPKNELTIRDPVSLGRFKKICGRDARLVADVAFLLKPNEDFPLYKKVLEWKYQGEGFLLAVNFSTMLLRQPTEEQLEEQRSAMASLLNMLLEKRNCRLLLIPHDYREDCGDYAMLKSICSRLHCQERVFFAGDKLGAAQLKALVGIADALLTARMHLSIAMLSFAKPICAFDYQGKFQGLYRHFDYDEKYLLENPSPANVEEQYGIVCSFLDECPSLQRKLAQRLPGIMKMAEENLDFTL